MRTGRVVTVMVAAVAAATVAFTAASCVDRSAAERAGSPVDAPIVPVGLADDLVP